MTGSVLDLQGLSRRFGDTQALDDMTFSVADGSMHGFVGRNGAGKTTTMRIVLGVLAADSGTVRWRGEPLGRAERSRFGYMPEERGLYPKMAVLDQLVHFARLHGLTADDAKKRATALIDRLGLGERIGDAVQDLSLGNQQRVQLGVALVHDPEFLVLDEPFSGLDPTGVDVLADVLLERVRNGVGVLFSSHQLELVERLCDAVAIIEGGRLRAEGTVAELRARNTRDRWEVELDGAPAADWAATTSRRSRSCSATRSRSRWSRDRRLAGGQADRAARDRHARPREGLLHLDGDHAGHPRRDHLPAVGVRRRRRQGDRGRRRRRRAGRRSRQEHR
jgi:ABC-2 type transport system ATP-binding protein